LHGRQLTVDVIDEIRDGSRVFLVQHLQPVPQFQVDLALRGVGLIKILLVLRLDVCKDLDLVRDLSLMGRELIVYGSDVVEYVVHYRKQNNHVVDVNLAFEGLKSDIRQGICEQ
jgi:hypothetical protein